MLTSKCGWTSFARELAIWKRSPSPSTKFRRSNVASGAVASGKSTIFAIASAPIVTFAPKAASNEKIQRSGRDREAIACFTQSILVVPVLPCMAIVAKERCSACAKATAWRICSGCPSKPVTSFSASAFSLTLSSRPNA